MGELILHDKNGFLVKHTDEAVEVIKNINQIDRRYCYEWALARFTTQKMTDGYLNVYKEILNS